MVLYLIMKNIYINPLFYIVALIMLTTGFFKPFLFMIIYLLLHELGHILVAYILGYKVKKISIFPCGLLTIFDIKLNDSILKNFLIALAGPLFQIISFQIIKKYYFIHIFLLIFNLLPIYPLDGSKIISSIFYILFSYKKTNDILFIISYILCIFFITYFTLNFNLIYILIFIVLIIKIIEFYKQRKYIFNTFILERMNYNFNFISVKKIKSINQLYKSRYHYILENNKYIDEKTYLNKKFNQN